MIDISATSRQLWETHRNTDDAVQALYDMALSDHDLYRQLCDSYLRNACRAEIVKVQLAGKNKFRPAVIQKTITERVSGEASLKGRPRIPTYESLFLWFTVNKKPLGDATALDIKMHVEAREKKMATEQANHVWLRGLASRLSEGQKVSDVFTEEEATRLKAQVGEGDYQMAA